MYDMNGDDDEGGKSGDSKTKLVKIMKLSHASYHDGRERKKLLTETA